MVPSLFIDRELFFLILHIKNYPQNHSILSRSKVTYPVLIFTCRTLDHMTHTLYFKNIVYPIKQLVKNAPKAWAPSTPFLRFFSCCWIYEILMNTKRTTDSKIRVFSPLSDTKSLSKMSVYSLDIIFFNSVSS